MYALAKDLARVTADSLDTSAIYEVTPQAKEKKLGSIKSLENLLSQRVDREKDCESYLLLNE